MGSFIGHVFPGILFLVAGGINLIHDFYVYARHGVAGLQLRSYKRKGKLFRWLEALFKIGGGLAGFYFEDHEFNFSTTWAATIGHKTMYVGFSLAGAFDAVTLLGLLPNVASPLATAAAIGMEGVIFLSHAVSTQDSDLELRIHIIYPVIALIGVFAAVNEITGSKEYRPLWILTLGASIVLQGSWSIQAGFFMYGDLPLVEVYKTKEHRMHHPTDYVTSVFVWHMMWVGCIVTAGIVVINIVHKCRSRWCGKADFGSLDGYGALEGVDDDGGSVRVGDGVEMIVSGMRQRAGLSSSDDDDAVVFAGLAGGI